MSAQNVLSLFAMFLCPKAKGCRVHWNQSILQHAFLVKATRRYPLPDMTLLWGWMCKASILARQITLLQSHEHTPLAYKICKTSQDSIVNATYSGLDREKTFSQQLQCYEVCVRSIKDREESRIRWMPVDGGSFCFWIAAQTGQKQQAATVL